MKRIRTNRRGTSLAEVITATGLLTMLLGAMVALTVNASAEWTQGSSKMMADSDASMAMQTLAADARTGIRATISANAQELTVIVPVKNAQGDYDRFVEDPAGIRYFLSSGNLCRQKGAAAATILARRVNSVRFVMGSSNSQVNVTLTAQQRAGTRYQTTTYETQITLRNEPPS